MESKAEAGDTQVYASVETTCHHRSVEEFRAPVFFAIPAPFCGKTLAPRFSRRGGDGACSTGLIFLSRILLSKLRALLVALIVFCSVGRIGTSPRPDRPMRTTLQKGEIACCLRKR